MKLLSQQTHTHFQPLTDILWLFPICSFWDKALLAIASTSQSASVTNFPADINSGLVISLECQKKDGAWGHLLNPVLEQRTFLHTIDQGSPTPGSRTGNSLWPVRNWATQLEISCGQMSKTETILPPSVEKLSSAKPIPFAKNVGDCCCRLSVSWTWPFPDHSSRWKSNPVHVIYVGCSMDG